MESLPDLQEGSSFDIKSEILKYLKKWPWFLLSILFALIAAWLYLRYTPKQYESRSSVLINTEENKRSSISMQDFQDLAVGGNVESSNLQDEISIMKSKPLLTDVVETLNLTVQFYNKGRVIESGLYEEVPLSAELKITDLKKFNNQSYEISPVNNQSFKLVQEGTSDKIYQFGQDILLKNAILKIFKNKNSVFNNVLKISLTHPEEVVTDLENNIFADLDVKSKSNIVQFSMMDLIPQRSETILNQLIKQYNKDAISNKNMESQNTADFIDGRLDLITKELGSIEDQKASYKRENQITDLVTQAQLSVENANDATKKIMEVGTQLEMVNSVLSYATSANNEQLLPSNMGMPSGLDASISEYNQLVLTRNKTLRQATSANPAVIQFNKDIAALRSLIRENLQKSRFSLQTTISSLQQKVNDSKIAVGKFPQQEKIFRNIDRQQNIKEALYLYLLQKREETSIGLAVTTPKARVVNPAYTVKTPVSPERSKIYLIAFALGLFIPFILIYTITVFDTKILNKGDVSKILPNIPLLAEIPTADAVSGDLVMKNDLTVYAEAFRILTTNLKFMLTKVQGRAPIILFTSSVKGEGKTTVSMNSAISLSSKKKVVIIGADLRNPQLKRYIPGNHLGLADYLADDSVEIATIINPSGLNPNLDIIDSGNIPPNPTDLLEDGRLKIILDELVMMYDYVLIDSAPMMMVSDTFHILNKADVLVYVSRANYTEKKLLDYIKTVVADENVAKLGIVLNDVNKSELRYGYGGKYGYGYYSDEKQGFWQSLKIKMKYDK